MRIAYISASLGGFDVNIQGRHEKQILPDGVSLDFFYYTDANFPPRVSAMKPRLQAKIPKMLGWELVPDYDYYIWGDANITLDNSNSVRWLLEQCGNSDIAMFKHYEHRNSLRDELASMLDHLQGHSGNAFAKNYLSTRYANEPMAEQVEHYLSDAEFKDDKLYACGMFVYRNIPSIQRMLRDWFTENARWSVQDQLSLPYVLSKSDCKVSAIDASLVENQYLHYYYRRESNMHQWDNFYKKLPDAPSAHWYGDTCTYEKGADFLKDCKTVEDWGVGAGGFKRYRADAIGIDGSHTKFADRIEDLAFYRSNCEGIYMRHVLEHNREWRWILNNALASASKKLAIVVFTPFSDGNVLEIKDGTDRNKFYGINVPNLSLPYADIAKAVAEHSASMTTETYNTDTEYGKETIIYITKP